ncbi:MAG: 30S ribosomal protein S16 [Acidobacteriota bacterium]|nr:30S ribosomal protein S16 [Acidobacteriota bacterium]
MAVRLRLTRVGAKKNPIWRVVVADQRSPRDGRVIERIGHYNPQTAPSTVVLDAERAEHWIARGAQPTAAVRKLLKIHAAAPPAGARAGGHEQADDAEEPGEAAEPSEASAVTDQAPEDSAPTATEEPAEQAETSAGGPEA